MPDIFLHLDGQQKGPLSTNELRQLAASGQVNASTPAWKNGLADWTTLGALAPEIFGVQNVPPPPPSMPMPPPPPSRKKMHPGVLAAIIVGVCVFFLGFCPCMLGIALGPITNGIKKAQESAAMQTSRAIGLAMFQYAVDHNGNYPDGKTSTEVFQKLIDENYVSDPAIFYLKMPGKTKATSKHLTAENVCFDVTSGVTNSSPDSIPLVFSTGYTMTYEPGARLKLDLTLDELPFHGIAITYKSHLAKFIEPKFGKPMPEVVPEDFRPDKTYTQLKP